MKPDFHCSIITLLLFMRFIRTSMILPEEWGSFEDVEYYTSQNDAVSNQTTKAYSLGVRMGIINPTKYSFESFERDEINVFKDLYKEYISMNGSHPINYQEWLVMNNFGILPDTQQSLLEKKIFGRTTSDNKRVFINTVKKGDILISGVSVGGLIGHAAIMTSDYWVLEMKGGRNWQRGIKNNNRQIAKDEWYEEYSSEWTTVYRCPNNVVAREAAIWADYNYYNPSGGTSKTKKIRYLITTDLFSINPSYSSKLVLQAYYFGTGQKEVVQDLYSITELVISPARLPSYFIKPYKLKNKGEY